VPVAARARGLRQPGARAPASDAAHRSGQFGADEPGREAAPKPERGADKRPHPNGPEYEEGGQYPGTRKPGAQR
jgi:hypothetical protein